jgi:hypothetical protein
MMQVTLAVLPITRDYSARWKYYGDAPERSGSEDGPQCSHRQI